MIGYLAHRENIEGLQGVADTAKASEKIAAASIHILRANVNTLKEYTANLENTLHRLTKFYNDPNARLLRSNRHGKRLLLIVGGDKGLVGGLWHELISTATSRNNEFDEIAAIGTKVTNMLRQENITPYKEFPTLSNYPTDEEIQEITDYLFKNYQNSNLKEVKILYPEFTSIVVQQPKIVNLLPFSFSISDGGDSNENDTTPLGFPIFSPNKKKIFSSLLNKYISVIFREIAIESKLSELSARTVIMEHAEAKTKQLIKKSKLDYMRTRRQMLTQKQLESFSAHELL